MRPNTKWLCVGIALAVGATQGRVSSKDSLALSLEARKNIPLVLSADEGEYNQEDGIFTARGHICLRQEDLALYADKLIYHEKQDWVRAEGRVRLEDAEGNLLLCTQALLTNRLKEGVLDDVQMLTRTRERLTAARILRKENSYHQAQEMEMGSYTPCEKCIDSLSPPVWSLHARHVHHDEKIHQVHYTDAHFEFLGRPVAYLPYFSHPLKRTSGWLKPTVSATPELGLSLGVPYYWAINTSQDLTITPFVTTEGGLLLAPQYRQRFNDADFMVEGALNFPGEKRISRTRGYLHAKGAWDISPHWRFRTDEWGVTDQTFFSTRPFFGHSTAPYLSSQSALEGFFGDSFIQIRGLRYQGLQERHAPHTPPFIYPETHFFYTSPPLWQHSSFSLHASTLSLYRAEGPRMQRGTLESDWSLPLRTSWGQEITLFSSVHGSVYWLTPARKVEGRIFPQGGAEARWPLLWGQIVLTPVAHMVLGPEKMNDQALPNEDSQDMTFDDMTLLAKSRYSGLDRLDKGSRANYGLEGDVPLVLGGRALFFVGQSYAFSKPSPELSKIGVRRHGSDFVGRLEISAPGASLFYRFRCDRGSLALRLQEIGWQAGPPRFQVAGSYLFSQRRDTLFSPYRQIYASLSSQIVKHWSTKIFFRKDLKTTGSLARMLDKGIEGGYQDECFAAGLMVQHTYYQMGKDLKPGYSIGFYISLKNMGGTHHTHARFKTGF